MRRTDRCARSASACPPLRRAGVQVLACAPKLSVIRKRPAAHMVFCTNIAFSADGKRVLSASADASVSVTDATLEPRVAIQPKQ